MIISHNKIVNLPIYFENKKINTVKNIVIDPTKGLFLFLETENNNYFKSEDVKEILNDKIILNNSNFFNDSKKGVKIINLKVQTESGEFLGKVLDFEIDLLENKINKIYVFGGNIIKKLIRGELIINRSQIISIDSDKIIVEDIITRKNKKDKILPKEKLAGASFCIKVN